MGELLQNKIHFHSKYDQDKLLCMLVLSIAYICR